MAAAYAIIYTTCTVLIVDSKYPDTAHYDPDKEKTRHQTLKASTSTRHSVGLGRRVIITTVSGALGNLLNTALTDIDEGLNETHTTKDYQPDRNSVGAHAIVNVD